MIVRAEFVRRSGGEEAAPAPRRLRPVNQAERFVHLQSTGGEVPPRPSAGGWLQDAGYHVLTCPGPSAPEYSCIGSRAGRCPLVDPASLVVLDLSFSPDAMVRAPIGAHLLGFYLLTGKPIIALGRGDDLLADPLENQLVALERTPDRGDFLATVRSVIPA